MSFIREVSFEYTSDSNKVIVGPVPSFKTESRHKEEKTRATDEKVEIRLPTDVIDFIRGLEVYTVIEGQCGRYPNELFRCRHKDNDRIVFMVVHKKIPVLLVPKTEKWEDEKFKQYFQIKVVRVNIDDDKNAEKQ